MTAQNVGMQSQRNHRAHVHGAAKSTAPTPALLLLNDDLKASASNVEMRITGCAHARNTAPKLLLTSSKSGACAVALPTIPAAAMIRIPPLFTIQPVVTTFVCAPGAGSLGMTLVTAFAGYRVK